MADFTLNAPGTTNNPWNPANVIQPAGDSTHGLRTDATGIRGNTAGGKFGHDAAYGATIVSSITYADQSNGDLDVVGAIVRTGANAGCIIGVVFAGSGCRVITEDASGSQTNISTFATYPATRANGDVFIVTVSISGGTATVTSTQNGSAITFNVSTTTTYATETTLAAGGNLSPTNYISQFTGTGVSVVGIAFNTASNGGDQTAVSTYSGSHSWSGTNRMASIDVPCLGPGVTVTAMTYGGAACTYIGSCATSTSFGSVECWRICSSDAGAPAAGVNTLSITLSGSIEFTPLWSTYTGVNQFLPTEAFNSAQATNAGSATDASVSITTVADNCWVHAAVVANDTSITAGNTSRNNVSGVLGSGANEDNNAAKTPAGAVSMSYSGMGTTTTWAIAGYAIRPVAAANDTGFVTRFNSSANLSSSLTTSVKLATTLNSVSKMAAVLSTSSLLATLLAAHPVMSPTMSTAFNLQSSLRAISSQINALTNWSTVTLAGTLYNGNGSAISPYLWTEGPPPPVGTTLYYDATYITIYSDAQTSSSQANASSIVQWYDGVRWWVGEIVYTDSQVTYFASNASVTNDLSTSIPLLTSYRAAASMTNGLTTIVSLVTNVNSQSSMQSSLTTGIAAQASLISTAKMLPTLGTGISLQTSFSSVAAMSSAFSTALNATLVSSSRMTAAMSSGIPLSTSFSSIGGLSATFALPDTSQSSVWVSQTSIVNALTTAVQLQTTIAANASVTSALATGIPLSVAFQNVASMVNQLGGASASLVTQLISKSEMVNDLYAYYPFYTHLSSHAALTSSLETNISLATSLVSDSAISNSLTVVAVQLPPEWRRIYIGPSPVDAINGQVLPDKDPDDVLDYAVVLSDEANEPDPLKQMIVSVESVSPDESPVVLTIDSAVWAMSDPASGVVDSVVFWLSGGTIGSTYVLRIEADDTETSPHMRVIVRRFTITVAKQ